VAEVLGRSPEEGIDPEEVVARGAAVQAGILAGATRQMVLLDVTPLALGIQTAGERMEVLVPRNTALPAAARALFTTVADYQRRADITVLQGERLQAADDIRLGSFQLEDLNRTAGAVDIGSASRST
jgi:molecular chaperone DnaK